MDRLAARLDGGKSNRKNDVREECRNDDKCNKDDCRLKTGKRAL